MKILLLKLLKEDIEQYQAHGDSGPAGPLLKQGQFAKKIKTLLELLSVNKEDVLIDSYVSDDDTIIIHIDNDFYLGGDKLKKIIDNGLRSITTDSHGVSLSFKLGLK